MTNERKLVTVRTVSALLPIQKADKIEVAVVDGWKVVVKKGEFKPGDRGLYFEIDSFLPVDDPRFEFLQKSGIKNYLVGGEILRGMVLRTVRMRGQLSQGLLLPLSDFPNIDLYEVYVPLENQLGVILYEKPIPPEIADKVVGVIPGFLKTRQERIQNIDINDLDLDETYEITEKLDGESCTAYLKEDGLNIGVCMRNYELKEDGVFWPTIRKYDIEEVLQKIYEAEKLRLAFQGEVYKHYNIRKFFIFDMVNMDTQEKLSPEERQRILNEYSAEDGFDCLDHVPQIGLHTLKEILIGVPKEEYINHILKMADGNSLMGFFKREGLVLKSACCSFKVISNSFLEASE